jgi:superoxide dismutase
MDMHEHSYFHDYLADKHLYVKAMMLELDWEIINQRFEKANRIADIMQPKHMRGQ